MAVFLRSSLPWRASKHGDGVHLVAATPDLEVQMRSGGVPRFAAEPKALISRDGLALDHQDLGKVCVDG